MSMSVSFCNGENWLLLSSTPQSPRTRRRVRFMRFPFSPPFCSSSPLVFMADMDLSAEVNGWVRMIAEDNGLELVITLINTRVTGVGLGLGLCRVSS